MAKYILRGIPTNDETLMVDEIIEVGSEEDFLSRMSTLKLMRAHQSKAGLIDRRVREEWEMDGGTDLYTRVQREGQGARREPHGRAASERRRGRDPGHRQEGREGRGSRLKPGAPKERTTWRTKDPMADFESLKKMIIDGDDGATAATQQLIDGGASARDILDQALLPGMDVVGAQMKSGDKFIPEVLLSARTMQACLDLIKPHLAAGESVQPRHGRHRHRRGRHARHRQEPRRHAALRRRLRGRQPRQGHHARRLRGRRQGARRRTSSA